MQKFFGEKGMTLVEMLVAVSIIGLLMGAIGITLSKTLFVNRYVFEQGLNNAELQHAIQDFNSLAREAKQGDSGEYMLFSADSDDIVFFANIDDDAATEKVHYYLQNGNLMRGSSEAAGFPPEYPAEDQETESVGRGIINTASQPMFYYYNDDYPVDMTNNPLPTPASTADVSLIKIDIFANVDPGHAPDTMRMETFVRPRNFR